MSVNIFFLCAIKNYGHNFILQGHKVRSQSHFKVQTIYSVIWDQLLLRTIKVKSHVISDSAITITTKCTAKHLSRIRDKAICRQTWPTYHLVIWQLCHVTSGHRNNVIGRMHAFSPWPYMELGNKLQAVLRWNLCSLYSLIYGTKSQSENSR